MDLHEANENKYDQQVNPLTRSKSLFGINNSVVSDSVFREYQHSPFSHQSDMDSPKNFKERKASIDIMRYDDDDDERRDSFLSDRDQYENDMVMRSQSDVDSAPNSAVHSN